MFLSWEHNIIVAIHNKVVHISWDTSQNILLQTNENHFSLFTWISKTTYLLLLTHDCKWIYSVLASCCGLCSTNIGQQDLRLVYYRILSSYRLPHAVFFFVSPRPSTTLTRDGCYCERIKTESRTFPLPSTPSIVLPVSSSDPPSLIDFS